MNAQKLLYQGLRTQSDELVAEAIHQGASITGSVNFGQDLLAYTAWAGLPKTANAILSRAGELENLDASLQRAIEMADNQRHLKVMRILQEYQECH